MSGPTWLPPKQAGLLGQPGLTVSAPALCRPQKSFASVPVLPQPAYGSPEANGTTTNAAGPSPRYQPPLPGIPPLLRDPSPERHYERGGGGGSRGSWGGASHSGYPLQPGSASLDQGPLPPSSIDVQIDSLTSMLADMESARHRRGERMNLEPTPYPPQALPQPGAPKPAAAYKPGLSGTFPPSKPPAFASDNSYTKSAPYGSGQPSQPPPFPATAAAPSQYTSSVPGDPYGASYPHRAAGAPKPYPQPMPASYATASSSAGPPVHVQVKVAQPVLGYHPPRRRPEHAYGPPSSPQPGYGARPPPQ